STPEPGASTSPLYVQDAPPGAGIESKACMPREPSSSTGNSVSCTSQNSDIHAAMAFFWLASTLDDGATTSTRHSCALCSVRRDTSRTSVRTSDCGMAPQPSTQRDGPWVAHPPSTIIAASAHA